MSSSRGERSPLLSGSAQQEPSDEEQQQLSVPANSSSEFDHKSAPLQHPAWNLVLLLGVFSVNADSSFLLASFREIASEFNKLRSASWIINSYVLGIIVFQPVYGKLSDIFGRKSLLLFAYGCFSCGSLLIGFGSSFKIILIGRAIAGIANAGIMALASILIVDLVAKEDIAVWRSYVYTINQIGRAVGPAVGGILTDKLDWRWWFLAQAPISILSMLCIWWKLSFNATPSVESEHDDSGSSKVISKLRRVDISGSIALAISNCALLLLLDQIQAKFDIQRNAAALVEICLWPVFLAIFVYIEAFVAREPILPLRLLVKRDVFSSYAVQFLQTAVQLVLFTSLPLYFRVTQADSGTSISLKLLVVISGVVVGGLVSGFVIKRTGRHRLLVWSSSTLSNVGLVAIFVRWRGHTLWPEVFYAFPVALGFGVSVSASFIALTSRLHASQIATAISGFYLSLNIGSPFGLNMSTLIISRTVQKELPRRLHGSPDADEILRKVTSNLDSIDDLPDAIRKIIVETYTKSLTLVWLFGLVCGCLALLASLFMRESARGKAGYN